jgi:zinc protease
MRNLIKPLTGLWLTAALLSGAAAQAQTPAPVALPAGVTRGASVEGITEYQLKNGLKVLLFPDVSKPTVTVNITYLVGSRHEGLGEAGMAHLLEHMVFKGSTNHPDVTKELSSHGADFNGTTWLDRTNYFETVPATDDNLKWALAMEADRMVNSFIKKSDLESEFSVVRNEFEIGENNPGRVLNQRVTSAAFLWHNYGKSTIGNRSDIERVPIENLQAFYRKFYQPDNAVLLVAGKIDEAKTLAMVSEYFAAIPRPTRELAGTHTIEPVQDGERNVTLRRTGDTQALLTAYHIMPGTHPDYPTMDVLTELLTNQPGGRLYKKLVETKKATAEYGYTFGLREPGIVYFGANLLKTQSLADARKVMLNVLDSVGIDVPTKAEVERAKAKLLKDVEIELRSTDRVGVAMSEFISGGDWRMAFVYRDRLEKVEPADVARVAKYYLKPSNRTVGQFEPDNQPDRTEVPDATDVTPMVSNYKGRAVMAQGEAFDATPANIDARTKRFEPKNTIELALLPKLTKGNEVNARLTLRLGDAKSLENKRTISGLVAAMLDKGTTTRSRQQIKDELDKLKAQVQFYGQGSGVNVNIKADRANLPAVIRLMTDVLKNPAFDPAELDKLRQERLAGIESQRSDPQAQASLTYGRLLNPYAKEDVRYSPTFDEQIEALKAVKIEDLKAFHRDFYGAQNATMAVVGDFDEATVRKAVQDDLGAWKAKKPYVRIPSVVQPVKSEIVSLETPDKANAMMLAGLTMPVRDTDPDYPALVLGNYMLGGGALSSRLMKRIRGKEGLSYAVGSFVNASALDPFATFTTYAMYNPQNAEKLEKAFREELEKLRNEGVTAEELKEAKSGYLQDEMVSRAQDPSLADDLSYNLFLNRTMAYDADLDKKLEALTPEQINAVIKKYIDPAKLIMVKAGDFAKAAKKAAEAQPAGAVGTGKKE